MNKGTRDLGSYLLDSGNEETCWGWDWASFPSCSYLKGRRTLWAPVIIVWNLFWQLRLQDLQYSIPKTFLAMISHSEMDRPMHRLCSSMLAWAPAAEILGGPGVQKPASHLSALAQTCQTNCDSIHCAHAHLLSTGYSQSNPNATEQVRAITRAPGPGDSEVWTMPKLPSPAVSPAWRGVLSTRRKGQLWGVWLPSHDPEE